MVLGKTENKGVKTLDGSFTTAPPKELSAPIHFMVPTCHEYGHQDIPENGGFKILNEMKKLKPHFLVHTGEQTRKSSEMVTFFVYKFLFSP